MEGAAAGTYENLDDRFNPESIIDDDILQDVVQKIVVAFEVYRDKVVIKYADGTTTGRLVAAFEFIYFPKLRARIEQGCTRATQACIK